MDIKRFVDKDSRSAMKRVRETFGAEAIILSSRRVGREVEILASADVDFEALRARATDHEPTTPAALSKPVETPPITAPTSAAPKAKPRSRNNDIALKRLQKELLHLRGMLEHHLQGARWQTAVERPPARATVQQRLLQMGLSSASASEIVDALSPGDQGLRELCAEALKRLADRVHFSTPLDAPGSFGNVALVGASGCGKTSVLIKLALATANQVGREHVLIVGLDPSAAQFRSPLSSLAARFGLNYLPVSSAEELAAAIADHPRCRVFVDTVGVSHRDPMFESQLDMLNAVRRSIQLAWVIPATTTAGQNREFLAALKAAGPDSVILTKVDEAVSLGGAIDTLLSSQLPLSAVSDAQSTAAGLELPTATVLINRAARLVDPRAEPTAEAEVSPTPPAIRMAG